MEVYHHHQRVDNNTDFFPVEHPMEPPDEDRPVKCPMPESSVISVSMCYSFFCYLLILRWQSMLCMVKNIKQCSIVLYVCFMLYCT